MRHFFLFAHMQIQPVERVAELVEALLLENGDDAARVNIRRHYRTVADLVCSSVVVFRDDTRSSYWNPRRPMTAMIFEVRVEKTRLECGFSESDCALASFAQDIFRELCRLDIVAFRPLIK
jgi:hypothetical protein